MRTFVYVDGFNLYYGALRGTPWKWLDLTALFTKVLQPHHDILKVKYFTARVSGTPADQSKPQRQDVCLRALLRYRRRRKRRDSRSSARSIRPAPAALAKTRGPATT